MTEKTCPPGFRFSFLNEVKTRYEKSDPEKFDSFLKILNDFGSKVLSENPQGEPKVAEQMAKDLRSEIATLFADEPELVAGFDESCKEVKVKASEKWATEFNFDNHVKLRFADSPDKLAKYNKSFSEAGKLMREDLSPQNVQEVWKGTCSQVRAILEGEPDLLEEFELCYLEVQALGVKEA